MKQQVVVIHGGDAFATYEEYLRYLRLVPIDPFRGRGWKGGLAEALGEGFEIIQPHMPNAENAKYEEWKIWFEKHIPFIRDGVILVGHSLGGVFLTKYLSENTFPKKIAATFLVAAPYDYDGSRALVEFILPESLAKCEEQGGEITLYHSKDDPIVAFSELAKYEAALPNAKVQVFDSRGHFLHHDFPEIVAEIKRVTMNSSE